MGNSPEATRRRERIVGRPEEAFTYIRSWIWAPLINKDEVIGALSLEHQTPNYYNQRHATLEVTRLQATAQEGARTQKGGPSLPLP